MNVCSEKIILRKLDFVAKKYSTCTLSELSGVSSVVYTVRGHSEQLNLADQIIFFVGIELMTSHAFSSAPLTPFPSPPHIHVWKTNNKLVCASGQETCSVIDLLCSR